jgi:DNA-binding response OmpR family regulator
MHGLIIEQDAWVVLMIAVALDEAGYTSFDVAATNAEAIAMAEKRCPDLITSDVRLGGSCGIQTVRSICSGRYIPVVFVTSTGWEVRKQSEELAFVQKPFSTRRLASCHHESAVGPAVHALVATHR